MLNSGMGMQQEPVPSFVALKRFETVHDLFVLLKSKGVKQFDSIIVCAAIANYIPKKQKGKIPSGKEIICYRLCSSTNCS